MGSIQALTGLTCGAQVLMPQPMCREEETEFAVRPQVVLLEIEFVFARRDHVTRFAYAAKGNDGDPIYFY
jgi:hypothetical protein